MNPLKIAIINEIYTAGATRCARDIEQNLSSTFISQYYPRQGKETVRSLFKGLAEFTPDLIHCHSYYGDFPYAMLAGALPPKKMGYYMGVFNFFIVIPQMVAATILGFMVSAFFGNQPIYALVAGGIAMILSGLLTLRVDDQAVITIDEVE